MDIATSLGLLSGIGVTTLVILMGGDLHMFVSEHAAIVIFGGSFAATLIRFPLSAIMHGLPLGARFAFTMRRMSQRELVDELAGLAEVARKQGPMGLEKVEIDDPFFDAGVFNRDYDVQKWEFKPAFNGYLAQLAWPTIALGWTLCAILLVGAVLWVVFARPWQARIDAIERPSMDQIDVP